MVAGTVPGRTSAGGVTLFKSVGPAVEDVATAHRLHRKASLHGPDSSDGS